MVEYYRTKVYYWTGVAALIPQVSTPYRLLISFCLPDSRSGYVDLAGDHVDWPNS